MKTTAAKKGWGVFKDDSDKWNKKKDADDLFNAMKGAGTNEKELIRIVCGRSREYLQELQKTYKERVGKDLIADIKAETSLRFEKVLVSQLTPRYEWIAHLVKESFKGAGVKARELVALICTRTGFEIKELAHAYKKVYGTDLAKDVEKEVGGPALKKFLVRICEGDRDDNEFEVDVEQVKADAKKLYDAGEGKWGTDEATFHKIFATRPHAHLAAVNRAYADLTGKPLAEAIKKEFSGPIAKGLIACSTSIGEFFANALHKAMKGTGTYDNLVLNILTQLNFEELRMVNQWYLTKYEKTLHVAIGAEYTGDLKDAYLYLIPSTI
eukprot:TRINITY_DN287_c1_g1_i1.p1 TRINITY_DN287_c1_g1~~TRINITY_DN287_c1_g1_i1.p1  ORF type:complete len:325 (-),score=123.81 TRINITY_DN287_c1_g1_i1:39-1013(-)